MSLDTSDRATYLGASEVAAALGLSPWQSPAQLYLQKTGAVPLPDLSASDDIRRGHFLEPAIIEWYAKARPVTPDFVRGDVEYRHPDPALAFLRAHLDAADPSLGIAVEAKAPRSGAPWEQIPEHYAVQGYVQLACSGFGRVDFAVSHGGNEPAIYPLERDDGIIEYILERAQEFWTRVETHEPPEPRTVEDARALWPLSIPTSAIEATDAVRFAYDRLRSTRADQKVLEQREEELEAEIMRHLGDCEALTSAGETLCTWKSQVANRFDATAFKAAHPDLHAAFVRESASRVFRLAKGTP